MSSNLVKKEVDQKKDTAVSVVGNSENYIAASPMQAIKSTKEAKRVKDCSEEEIKNLLKYLIVLMGFPPSAIPTQKDLVVYYDFFYDVWGLKYTLQDFKNAFKLALAKKIDVKMELFGEIFSCQYISRFMDKYDEYKQSLLSTNPDKPLPESYQLPRSQKEIEEEEEKIYKVFEDYMIENKKLMIEGSYDVELCYRVLERKGALAITGIDYNYAVAKVKKEDEASLDQFRAKGKNAWEMRDEAKRLNDPKLLGYRVKRWIVVDYWKKNILKKK